MRGYAHLQPSERDQLAHYHSQGWGVRQIGRALSRAPSTISRELSRNSTPQGYRAAAAESEARLKQLRRRCRRRVIDQDLTLQADLAQLLQDRRSPRQALLILRRRNRRRRLPCIETVYAWLYRLDDQTLKAYLTRPHRHRGRRTVSSTHGRITRMVPLSKRPVEADRRRVVGHWEGDLVVSPKSKSAVVTLVERATRYTILRPVPERLSACVVAALLTVVDEYGVGLFKSITWDQGKELALHETFTVRSGVPVYFCNPHAPWERGTNENTNGVLRRWFPKGTEFTKVTPAELAHVERLLNTRPMDVLAGKTPVEKLRKATVALRDGQPTSL